MKEPFAILFKDEAFFQVNIFIQNSEKFFHYKPLSMSFSRIKFNYT